MEPFFVCSIFLKLMVSTCQNKGPSKTVIGYVLKIRDPQQYPQTHH